MPLISIPIYKQNLYNEISIYNYGVELINAPSFWANSYKGKGVNIAVIDSGCYVDHIELKERILGVYNFTTDDNGDPNVVTDYSGHGTHVSGIIAGSNKKRIIGVAPEANLFILKIIGKDGSGSYEQLIKAINFAIDWRGKNNEKIDVINLSLGGSVNNLQLRLAIDRAISEDIAIVTASGNYGDGSEHTDEILYPGFYEEVIQVSAIDKDKNPTHFSNTNPNIDFLAPGKNILSTYPDNTYIQLSGTSMAAPHISGAIALLLNYFRKNHIPVNQDLVYQYLTSRSLCLKDISKKIQGNGVVKI